MLRLRVEDLTVASFEPQSAASVQPINDTDQIECWSPLCGPTAARTCECDGLGG
jgi:hypothetical protein